MSGHVHQLVIDANGLAFRQFIARRSQFAREVGPWSLPAVVSSTLVDTLLTLIRDWKPRRVYVCWDASDSWTFRRGIFPAYKAHREQRQESRSPDDRLIFAHYGRQLRDAKTLLSGMGVMQYEVSGWEADDLIAALVRSTTERSLVVSGDKDLVQLVDGHVHVYDPGKHRVITKTNCRAVVGVEAERMLEYLTLVGDDVDGVPGIPGVGPVTAAKWLSDCASAEEIVARVRKPRKAVSTLRENMHVIERNRRLFRLAYVQQPLEFPYRPRWAGPQTWSVLHALQLDQMLSDWPTIEYTFGSLDSATWR